MKSETTTVSSSAVSYENISTPNEKEGVLDSSKIITTVFLFHFFSRER